MEREKELQSLLDIYKILRQDESEFNLYNNSQILEELIEKTEKDLKDLSHDKWWRKKL